MIGCTLLDVPNLINVSDIFTIAYQYKDRIYAIYGYKLSSDPGSAINFYGSHANILYI